ncbi:TfpX/TfpZ family type IV pilin accessory protein [Diaphorobacter limosus]|uniref:TfpX/TfpZ family type IV pilin accessory protein n=1 Tax=Diaphorobacter limosus TaxID=3036128 RepID=A0ABZ0JAZ4_9BURK|nr:TfpX/TfpZ family type IV pilin accessory protein [Diaphorobacter sp. Y-1]WOO34203.1 TfpX/TfpZ family type IV pilin accessory protein [Diaphorobacter sp. Y-1]
MGPALGAAAKHLGASAVVAAVVAWLVFGLWYPAPYAALAGGFALFGLVVMVDAVCGPLMTLVVFDRRKPCSELARDIGIIVTLQFAALAYGLYSLAAARPIFLSYEGNRFRVVSMSDVDVDKWPETRPEFRSPGYGGPRMVGAKLTEATDPNFPQSVTASLQGLHPSFRPDRWVPYESQKTTLQAELKPMATLKAKHPQAAASIDATLTLKGLTDDSAGYLPLDAEKASPADWVVIVERASGQPRAFLPLDGW